MLLTAKSQANDHRLITNEKASVYWTMPMRCSSSFAHGIPGPDARSASPSTLWVQIRGRPKKLPLLLLLLPPRCSCRLLCKGTRACFHASGNKTLTDLQVVTGLECSGSAAASLPHVSLAEPLKKPRVDTSVYIQSSGAVGPQLRLVGHGAPPRQGRTWVALTGPQNHSEPNSRNEQIISTKFNCSWGDAKAQEDRWILHLSEFH